MSDQPAPSPVADGGAVKPPYKCASCGHEWTEDVIWCPACRTGFRSTEVRTTETTYCADPVAMVIFAVVALLILIAFAVAFIVENWP